MDRELSYCFTISRSDNQGPAKRSSFAIQDILGLGEKDRKSKVNGVLQESAVDRPFCGTVVTSALELIPDKFSGKLLAYIKLLVKVQEIFFSTMYPFPMKTILELW